MNKIAIFGATGKTGRRVLHRALDAGLSVQALVRDPAKVTTRSDQLTLVRGDVLDRDAVDETVAGVDAVLSLFGQVKGSPRTLQTDGTQLIVDAMKRHGVNRLVTLSGGGLRAAEDRPGPADHVMRLLLKGLAGHVLADAEGHLRVLRDSGLDWTVVRGPRLTEDPGQGHYRVGHVGDGTGMSISRDDLADFIITQIDDPSHVGALPFVSN